METLTIIFSSFVFLFYTSEEPEAGVTSHRKISRTAAHSMTATKRMIHTFEDNAAKYECSKKLFNLFLSYKTSDIHPFSSPSSPGILLPRAPAALTLPESDSHKIVSQPAILFFLYNLSNRLIESSGFEIAQFGIVSSFVFLSIC